VTRAHLIALLIAAAILTSCFPRPPALGWHPDMPPLATCSIAGAGQMCAWYECQTQEAPTRWWIGALSGEVWLCDQFAAVPCEEAREEAEEYCDQPLTADPPATYRWRKAKR
jgi:hypothetical protein